MKWHSLLKAILTQDMSIFKYRTKSDNKLFKLFVPLLLFSLVSFCIGLYAYKIAEVLVPHNLTHVMLVIFLGITTLITYIEGIYKSMTIVFDSKDNDLLFSLPIKKTTILFVRIFKLILYQYIFNLMYILPAYAIYCYFEKPSFIFYPLAILMILLIPLIPTLIACLAGYLAKVIFSGKKKNKIMQTAFSLAFFLVVFYFSYQSQGLTEDIIPSLVNLSEKILLYYPIGLYMKLINNPSIIGVIKLILVNVVPFALFIYLASIFYSKIISKSKNMVVKHDHKEAKIKTKSPILSLANKELRKYISSPVYMMNTLFGLLLMVVGTVALCIKGDQVIATLVTNGVKSLSIDTLFYLFITIIGGFTTISSSSISLEGKTINITKSLPVSIVDIFKSKILFCYIIELPFMLLSLVIYIIFYKPKLMIILAFILIIILVIFITSVIGLIFNLKYPKLNYTNDSEVVKQSLSVMISLFFGIIFSLFSAVLVMALASIISIKTAFITHLIMMMFIAFISYLLLIKKGVSRYKQLNI